jgi:hypothetical protein
MPKPHSPARHSAKPTHGACKGRFSFSREPVANAGPLNRRDLRNPTLFIHEKVTRAARIRVRRECRLPCRSWRSAVEQRGKLGVKLGTKTTIGMAGMAKQIPTVMVEKVPLMPIGATVTRCRGIGSGHGRFTGYSGRWWGSLRNSRQSNKYKESEG